MKVFLHDKFVYYSPVCVYDETAYMLNLLTPMILNMAKKQENLGCQYFLLNVFYLFLIKIPLFFFFLPNIICFIYMRSILHVFCPAVKVYSSECEGNHTQEIDLSNRKQGLASMHIKLGSFINTTPPNKIEEFSIFLFVFLDIA